jgi:hypothetical protein
VAPSSSPTESTDAMTAVRTAATTGGTGEKIAATELAD